MNMNKSQQRAVDYFKGFMDRQLCKVPAYGDVVDTFDVKPTTYGDVWISATTDMQALGEGNLLRALDRQYWLVLIGKRGGMTVKMCPKSFYQFNGKKNAFGMSFDAGR
jgi:hypothetical protein